MQIEVLFFGVLRDIAGRARETINAPENTTVADILRLYESKIAAPRKLLDSIAISVNRQYAAPDAKLKEHDEVALLPPVSGGSEPPQNDGQGDLQSDGPDERVSGNKSRAEIVHEPIDTAKFVEKIKHPEDGAVVVFDGIVRKHSRGRITLYLDYDAYEEMALQQMNMLVSQALSQFGVREVAMVHRLGRLEIGETSVLIAVASEHRAPAFDACRWLIDTLKRTVPIWKKEHFEDGSVWAAGEPFPADIAGGAGSPASGRASK
jgi:MoaE-MoaD fusion protein